VMNRVFKRSFGRYGYNNNLRLQPGVECQLNLRNGLGLCWRIDPRDDARVRSEFDARVRSEFTA
jgi:hypothetical protein